jgi:hypothetical protein
MPTKARKLNGENALLAGRLGEKAVKEKLHLFEPDVEIKTMHLERKLFSVELTQLERQPDKLYVVCAYSRGRRLRVGNVTKGRKPKRQHEYSIQDAFLRSLTFALVSTDELLKLIKAGKYGIRWVEANYRTKARFVATFKLADITQGEPSYLGIDRVYNAPGLVDALSGPIEPDKVMTYENS